jgi:hypothetical protein
MSRPGDDSELRIVRSIVTLNVDRKLDCLISNA